MNSNAMEPRFEDWRVLVDGIQQRAASRSADFQACLKLCIEQRFMLAQLALVQPAHQISPITQPQLAEQVCECLQPLLNGTDSRLQATPFGNENHSQLTLHQTEFLWCLALETVTQVSAGSLVELSFGGNQQTIELEIGSDCKELEQAQLSQMSSIQWAKNWLSGLNTCDHRCPLGGGAVQVSFPTFSASRNRRTA